jgi:large subunit ribosomal protein L15
MFITDIKAPRGANRKKRALGRGVGSGRSKTSGRGNKGQGSRAGRDFRPGFEGGQMMLFRRLAKRGFTSRDPQRFQIVNVGQLGRFSKGATVTPENLFDEGLIKDKELPVKLLAEGSIAKPLIVKVHRASASAVKKVQEASGTVELVAAASK